MERSTVVVAMIAMLVGSVSGVSAQTVSDGPRVGVTTPEERPQDSLASTDMAGTVSLASDRETRSDDDGRRFSVRVEAGIASSANGAGELSDLMIQGGFDDSRENIFGGSRISFPQDRGGGARRGTIALTYRVRSRWSVTLMVDTGRSSVALVDGRTGPYAFADFESPSAFIYAEQTMASVVGLVSFLPNPGMRAGVGVSVSSLAVVYTQGLSALQRFEAMRPGLVLDVGLALPAKTRFFVDVGAQFRFLMPLGVGPVPVSDYDGDYIGTVPGGSVSFSHWRVTVGLGLRL